MNNNSDTYLEKNKKKQKNIYLKINAFFLTKKEQREYTFLHDVEKLEPKSHICNFFLIILIYILILTKTQIHL